MTLGTIKQNLWMAWQWSCCCLGRGIRGHRYLYLRARLRLEKVHITSTHTPLPTLMATLSCKGGWDVIQHCSLEEEQIYLIIIQQSLPPHHSRTFYFCEEAWWDICRHREAIILNRSLSSNIVSSYAGRKSKAHINFALNWFVCLWNQMIIKYN